MAEARGGAKGAIDTLKQAAKEWSGDRSPQIAAALAYYVLFSIAPLLVLATAVAGLVYGPSAARGQIVGQAARFVGPRVAEILQQILAAASKPRSGIVATVIGIVTLVIGATGAFASVQAALNQIWEVEPKSNRGVWGVIRDRLLTFVLLAAVGFLLLASLGASAALAAVTRSAAALGVFGGVLAQAANFAVFLVVMTLLFAFVFKVLPDARISWRDVWVGGLVTAFLFAIGQLVIGLYLSLVSVGSAYGASGSLIAILVWLNYSSMTFLFGAELTQVVAARHGSRIEPSKHAQRLQEPCAPPQTGTGEPNSGAQGGGGGEQRGQRPRAGGMKPAPQ